MRKFYTLLLALMLCTIVNAAEKNGFNKIFNRYSSQKGCEAVQIGKAMIRLISNNNKQLDGIEEILILNVEIENHPKFYQELLDFVSNDSNFEKMSSVISDGDKNDTYFEEINGKSYFLMINQADDEISAIYIHGVFNLKNVSEISKMVK